MKFKSINFKDYDGAGKRVEEEKKYLKYNWWSLIINNYKYFEKIVIFEKKSSFKLNLDEDRENFKMKNI